MDAREPISPLASRLRRLLLRANLAAVIVLAVVLFGMVNSGVTISIASQ